MKYALYFSLLILALCNAQHGNQKHIMHFFNKDRFNLSKDEQHDVEQLISWLNETPFWLEQQAAGLTLSRLECEVASVQHRIEEHTERKEQIDPELFYQQFILKEIIKHLRKFITQEHSILQKVHSLVSAITFSLSSLYRHIPTAQELSSLLTTYFLEVPQMLGNKDNLDYIYQSDPALPQLINLFDNEAFKQEIYKQID